jgi:hypothetical protein
MRLSSWRIPVSADILVCVGSGTARLLAPATGCCALRRPGAATGEDMDFVHPPVPREMGRVEASTPSLCVGGSLEVAESVSSVVVGGEVGGGLGMVMAWSPCWVCAG